MSTKHSEHFFLKKKKYVHGYKKKLQINIQPILLHFDYIINYGWNTKSSLMYRTFYTSLFYISSICLDLECVQEIVSKIKSDIRVF